MYLTFCKEASFLKVHTSQQVPLPFLQAKQKSGFAGKQTVWTWVPRSVSLDVRCSWGTRTFQLLNPRNFGPLCPIIEIGCSSSYCVGRGGPFGHLVARQPSKRSSCHSLDSTTHLKTYLCTYSCPDLCESRLQTIFLTITMQEMAFPPHLPLLDIINVLNLPLG